MRKVSSEAEDASCPWRLRRRQKDLGPALRAGHLHLPRSCRVAAQERAPEQNCRLLPQRAVVRTKGAPASGLARAAGPYKKTRWFRQSLWKKQVWLLGSLFLLWNLFLQHCLHNPDLGALRIVRVRREVEQLGILPRACRVKQIFHHDQSAIVMLNHPGQK